MLRNFISTPTVELRASYVDTVEYNIDRIILTKFIFQLHASRQKLFGSIYSFSDHSDQSSCIQFLLWTHTAMTSG